MPQPLHSRFCPLRPESRSGHGLARTGRAARIVRRTGRAARIVRRTGRAARIVRRTGRGPGCRAPAAPQPTAATAHLPNRQENASSRGGRHPVHTVSGRSPAAEAHGLTDRDIRAEAEMLDAAERERRQVRQTTGAYPLMTIDEAYRVQAAWLDLRLDRGEQVIGHKIGLTSRAMQQAMNIDTPDSGFLTDAMVFAPDEPVAAADFCDLRLEVELAFVLADDLSGADLAIDDVLDATGRVTAAVELIASRTPRTDPATGRTRTVVDTIADNAADAGIVTGGHPVGSRDLDLRWVGAVAYRNGAVEETGLAAGVLDHPANGVVWLARRYNEQGMPLRSGQVILSGSFTRPMAVAPGDEFRFDFGPLGAFSLPIV